jgi:hypothetical protein
VGSVGSWRCPTWERARVARCAKKAEITLGIWVPEEGVRSGRGIKEGRGSDSCASEVLSGAIEISSRKPRGFRKFWLSASCLTGFFFGSSIESYGTPVAVSAPL